jgi:hypothetical protein
VARAVDHAEVGAGAKVQESRDTAAVDIAGTVIRSELAAATRPFNAEFQTYSQQQTNVS